MEFADILEGFGRTAPSGETYAPGRAHATPEFWRVLDGFSKTAGMGETASRAAYRANDGKAETAPPKLDGAPLSTDPEDIADELDLGACTSLEELKTIRRLFARLNHPDRLPSAERERANTRMTIANAMIDEAAARFAR